jgi:hypothetical protein
MVALRALSRLGHPIAKRMLSGFSFAGPKCLDDVLKIDKVADKSTTELADIWYGFHNGKQGVLGTVSKGQEGKLVIERAREWYVQNDCYCWVLLPRGSKYIPHSSCILPSCTRTT